MVHDVIKVPGCLSVDGPYLVLISQSVDEGRPAYIVATFAYFESLQIKAIEVVTERLSFFPGRWKGTGPSFSSYLHKLIVEGVG